MPSDIPDPPTTRAAAKKATPPAKKSTRRPPVKSATAGGAGAAPPSSSSAKKVTGKIIYFDPATGRGAVESEDAEADILLDVAKTKILNKGYVRLDTGREVTVTVEGDEATDLLAE